MPTAKPRASALGPPFDAVSAIPLLLLFLACASVSPGCRRTDPAIGGEVVLYTSIDEPIARPILREFERRTGVHVRILTDAESNKTVGLAERLCAEKSNPQADVYWGNEVFNTIRLAEEGVLTGYDSPSVRDVPQQYKDPGNRWAANGLRVRVIANHDGPAAKMLVASRLSDLTDPRFRDHVLMARPTAGTTGGHVAALYVLWGKERAQKFFQDLRSNGVRLVGGNSIVADEVGRGTMWAGLTDNDDAAAARRDGGQLKTILPDQQGGEIGTLAIPCTVGLVAGAKHRPAAERLIDYLLSEEVERQLVDAQFAYASVRDGASAVKAMDVDYRKVAEAMPEAIRDATAILEGR